MTAPPPATTTDIPLAGLLAQAITNPGAVLPRRDHTETVNEWTYRAVLAVTGIDQVPAGMDARPVVMFTVHCSNCGRVAPNYEGDGRAVWEVDDLPIIDRYHLDSHGWALDPRGIDPDHEGRPVVCRDCWCIAWCGICDQPIHAWQPHHGDLKADPTHARCHDNEQAADALAAELEALGDAGMAAHMELAALAPNGPGTAARIAAIRAAAIPAPEATR